jgi:glycosyltransferase involved in cell wall biosynthesis
MRFHCLVPPHAITNEDFVGCAYTQKVVKFAKMMTQRGHEVFVYGVEGTQTQSTEDVIVVSKEVYDQVYGKHDYHSKFFTYDVNDLVYQTYYTNTIAEINKRKQANDFVLPFWGYGNKPITDALPDLITVEPGIGYQAQWARWRIYESHAIRNASYGPDSIGNCTQDYYHRVIPNYFDAKDFTYNENKEDYMLYLGRIYSGKGVDIAVDLAKETGKNLIIAGQGSLLEMGYTNIPSNIIEVGYADINKRKQLMANASCLIIGSKYNEPFAGVQVESFLSGTPVISPDWGAFTEYNIHGVSGFRCWTFSDYVAGVMNAHTLNPKQIREHGEQFLLERIAPLYERYFQDVLNVYTGKGWYQL